MNILKQSLDLFPFTQKLRRDFHKHPELGFKEIRTARIVAEELLQYGFSVKSEVGKTGVVGLLEGKAPEPVILLRFDMDALPIMEENQVSYRSVKDGIMHACGHDAHTAVGLTLAKLFSENKNAIIGTLKFVFQPAEEGLGGAKTMVEDGVLLNPKPDYCLSMHVWNQKPVGWLGITPGPIMAKADKFWVRITGEGGHGAVPSSTKDPIVATAHIINSLQTIISRNISPFDRAVLSITKVVGGTSFNIIPNCVELEGTIRTLHQNVYTIIESRFQQIVEGIALSMGCTVEIEISPITLPLVNDKDVVNLVQNTARELLESVVIESNYVVMGSEDMSYFMQDIPGCFIFVGSANPEKGLIHDHHNPKFDIDENCLPLAVALLAQSSMNLMAR